MFKVKTLAVLFSPYPREMKHIPRNLNLPPFWRLVVSIEMVQSIPTRALSRAGGLSMRAHLTTVEMPPKSSFRMMMSRKILIYYFQSQCIVGGRSFLLWGLPEW